ncbi:MAG: OmpH family outer membrane protein [Nitrospirota bacterium]
MKKVFILVVVLFCFLGSLALAADVKVGIIDVQRIIRESKVVQEHRANLSKEIEDKRKILAAKEEAIRALDDELKKEKMAPQTRREKSRKLAKEVKELKRLREDFEEESREKDAELTVIVLNEISEIIRKIASDGKYTIILEKGQGVVYATDKIDITSEVIKIYDKATTR